VGFDFLDAGAGLFRLLWRPRRGGAQTSAVPRLAPRPSVERISAPRRLDLSLEEALGGANPWRARHANATAAAHAPGRRHVRRDGRGVPPSCRGGAVVRSVRGHMVFSQRCAACDGIRPRAGRTSVAAAAASGLETRAETVRRGRFRAGSPTATRYGWRGKGHAGARGGGARGSARHRARGAARGFRRSARPCTGVGRSRFTKPRLAPVSRCRRPMVPRVCVCLRVTQSGQRSGCASVGVPSRIDGTRGDLLWRCAWYCNQYSTNARRVVDAPSSAVSTG
jgi:hypothetical protein